MKKFLIFLTLALVFALGLGHSVAVLAKEKAEIPEVDGVYNDPEHPGIKVRVFVHREKPLKPTPSPSLICVADPNSEAVVSSGAWHLPSSVNYRLNNSSVPSSVEASNLQTFASQGFSDWRRASGNKVNFTYEGNTLVSRSAYDGQNVITWGRTQGTALAVTYIRYYSSSGLVVDVDTIMNKKFPWSYSGSSTCADPNSYDAWNILEHEQGHWLGLEDEYDAGLYGNATMYGYGAKGEVKKTTLTTGDMTGAAAIYP